MGRQYTKAVFIGTSANLNGYIDDGRPYARLVDRKDRRSAGARAASVALGRTSKRAAQWWQMLPKGMRRMGGGCAFNTLVSTCLELTAEGGYHLDWDAFEPLDFGEVEHGSATWKAPSLGAIVYGLGRGRVDFSGSLASVRQSLAGYGEGRDAGWRLGAMSRRNGHYDLGTQFAWKRGCAWRYEGDRLDRAWNAAHARGIYTGAAPEFVDHFAGDGPPRWPLVREDFRAYARQGEAAQRGALRVRFWLHLVPTEGRGANGICTDWMAVDERTEVLRRCHPLPGSYDNAFDAAALRTWMDGQVDGREFMVFTAVEVAEKRGRHWVRIPGACGLVLMGVMAAGEVRNKSGRRRGQVTGRECVRGTIRRTVREAGRGRWVVGCFMRAGP